MNKKVLLSGLAITLTVTLAGCGARNTTALAENSVNTNKVEIVSVQKENNNKYEIIKEVFEDKDVKIEYPQVVNFKDENKQNEINELIKNEALALYLNTIEELDSTQTYTAEASYEIKLKNDNILSIAYSSYNNIVPSAHPYNLFHTTNIDLETGEKLELSNFVPEIDKAFIDILKNAEYAGEIDKEYGQQIRENAFGIYDSDEKLIEALYNKDGLNSIYAYVTEDALGISMPVGHAAGDHAEFEINISDLTDINILNWN